MTDQYQLPQSSPLTEVRRVAIRPPRAVDRMRTAGRRELLVLLASGLVVSTWALFPSTVESGIYVPVPEASKHLVGEASSAGDVLAGGPVDAYKLMNAKLMSSKPAVYGPLTLRYPRPMVDVSLVPLRSKLQALLMLLYSQSGDVDLVALEEKLQALLKLPDSVLAQLTEHPDLAELTKILDGVFLGTSDLSGVEAELDKIDVIPVPGSAAPIQVIKVNGKPAYIVQSPALQEADIATESPLSLSPLPSGPTTMTMVSQVEEPAGLTASTLSLAPISDPLASVLATTSQIVSAFTPAPSIEPLSVTPSVSPPPSASVEPTDTPQASQEIMTSGNKFEPGETATQPSGGNSSATETAVPMTPSSGQEGPAEAGGPIGGGGAGSPSNNEGEGTSSPSAGETNP
jgi:hypothetical protein